MRDIPPCTIKGHGKSKKEAHLHAAMQAMEYLAQCGVYKRMTDAQPAMHVDMQPTPSQPVDSHVAEVENTRRALSNGQDLDAGEVAPFVSIKLNTAPTAGASNHFPQHASATTLDHEVTLDDVDDIDDVAQLREYLKRALQEIQVFQAQVGVLKARHRRAVEALTSGDPL